MDGAAATVGGVTTLATAALALIEGDVALAVLCAGMSGACFGFLPYNLAGPARIFLGDGGSLPIGFVVAATIMALPDEGGGWTPILAAVILAGLPVLDTTLVMISRRRAGIPLLTAGRDHLTHRLVTRLGSPRAVARGARSHAGGARSGRHRRRATGHRVGRVGLGNAVPGGHGRRGASGDADLGAGARLGRGQPPRPTRRRRPSPTTVEAALIVFIAAACGLSPALYGFYRLSVWGPIALVLLAGLLGLLIARPAAPRRTAVVAAGGLVVPLAVVAAVDHLGRVGRPGDDRREPLDALRHAVRDPRAAGARRAAREAPDRGARAPRSRPSAATWSSACSARRATRCSCRSACTSRWGTSTARRAT